MDKHTANRVAWTLTLFPLLIYSVLFMREVIFVFLTLALYGVVTWIKNDSFKSIILAFLGFTGATLFHGAMFVGALVFILIVSIKYLKNL